MPFFFARPKLTETIVLAESSRLQVRSARIFLLLGAALGSAADEPVCPKASPALQTSCKEISYKDLPAGAKALLNLIGCRVGSDSNYDYGSAVDLNGDGSPEYQFCCHEAPHGPCGSVLIGKVKDEWKQLSSKEILGFEGACNQVVILASKHAGYHDLCLSKQVPHLLQFDGKQYRPK